MKALICILLLLIVVKGSAQEDDDPVKQNIIEQRIEMIAEQYEDEDVDFTTLFDELSYFYDNPLNLNNATKEDLNALFLLTDRQIIEFLDYRNKHKQLLTIYELQYVYTFDQATIDMILPFIEVSYASEREDVPLLTRLKRGRSQLFLRYQRILEEMEGYTDIEDSLLAASPNKRYLGSPDRIYLRYRYQFRNNLSIGLTADKDAGEEFFKGTQPNGFDFYSIHAFAKNVGKLKRVALGDFQVQYGQGLVFWSGLAFGKSIIVRNMKKNATGIRPYTSVDENLFLRGGAATIGLGKFEITAFGSYKKTDGNIAFFADTTQVNEELYFSSFQQTGYHRTPGELEDRDAIGEFHSGGHVAYKTERMNIGLSGVYTTFDSELKRNTQIYNQFDFQGKENANLSLDYNVFAGPFNFFGESAISMNGGAAHLLGMMSELDSRVRFIGIFRAYGRDYHALMANGFGEGGNTNNEIGTVFGIEAKINKRMNFMGYADFYKWNWLSYQKHAPTNGQDYIGQLNFQANRSTIIYLRYKWETKPRNMDVEGTGIEYPVSETRQQVRLHFDKRIGAFKFRSRLEWIGFDPNDGEMEHGYLLYQDLIWRSRRKPVSLAFRYALFETDSYDTRIYAYENDVLYAFSIPAYYFRGSRSYVTLKYSPTRSMDLWLRWGQFYYNDRNEISSGLNQINSNTKTEVKAQIRLKF